MGMYTELVLAVRLDRNAPIINTLKYMLGEIDHMDEDYTYKHPLFKTRRWDWMLTSDSFYFDGQTDSKLVIDRLGFCYLNVRCNLKNYDNEIDLFLDWLVQYIEYDYSNKFLGYKRYEEADHPTLIYARSSPSRKKKYYISYKHVEDEDD